MHLFFGFCVSDYIKTAEPVSSYSAQNRPSKLWVWIQIEIFQIQEFGDKAFFFPPLTFMMLDESPSIKLDSTSSFKFTRQPVWSFLDNDVSFWVRNPFLFLSFFPHFEHFDLGGLWPCCHERNTIREFGAAPASNLHTGKKQHYQQSRIRAEHCILCWRDNELI